MLSRVATLVVATLAAVSSAGIVARQSGKLSPVRSEGNAFWKQDGSRFYVRGVAYQPGGAADAADPMLDMDTFRNDVKRFKELGINTIRIYTVDNSADHDEAMALLDDAGIYLALDVNTPKYSLNRASTSDIHMSYNDVYLQSVFATVDAFAGYNNLLLFFSANEVINARNNTDTAPYIKAVTRDIKNYIRAQAPREIPVGYSSADVAENIESQALYFACGEDAVARSDFFAFNDYSWCDPSTFQTAGWDKKVKTYAKYPLPLFLSEFGCITNRREWNEVKALYSNQMTSVYSGGLAYEYTLEANGYGLVELGDDGQAVPNGDFERLRQAYSDTPVPSGDGGARRGDKTVPSCPPETDEWRVSTTLLPEMPKGAVKYMEDGAGKGPGLAGEGSQWHGTPSETEPDLSNGISVGSTQEVGNRNGGSAGNDTDDEGVATAGGRPDLYTALFAVGLGLAFAC